MSKDIHPEVEFSDSDLIELKGDDGRVFQFFHVGSTKFLNKWYAFFMPAEEIDGVDEETVVIFEVKKDENGTEALLPVDDELLLEQVYEQFCREMDEEADCAEAEELEGGDCCEDDDECCCHGEGHCHHEGEHHHDGECCHGEGHHHHDGECCHGEGHHKKGECKGEGKKGGCKKHKN